MHDATAPTPAGTSGPGSGWPEVASRPRLAELDRAVRQRWAERQVFARSVEGRAGGPVWTFYEGPPTANGRPGTHHAEARTFKDVFPRHRTMKGMQVIRRAGWDCHGLPVELEAERKLGLNSKRDIEAYGIAEFNAQCRASVLQYVDAWRDMSERLGYWVDMDAAYWTMDASYIQSVWWALKQLHQRDQVFEASRVSPYCGRCGTVLSDAEVSLGYQDVEEDSVYVRFPLLDGDLGAAGASLLIWTTTPWTLPGNVAVAIGEDIDYVLVDAGGALLVLADARRAAVLPDAEVVRTVPASELVGARYRAPFEFAIDPADAARSRLVLAADFVTTDEGSGLVHIAPAFGADDAALGRRHDLPMVNPVDRRAAFAEGPWEGQFVKDADPAIIATLDQMGVLHASVRNNHSYPHCWRCGTALIYYAKPSWYVRTTAKRQELMDRNAGIDWHPPHIRDGRFGNWLVNNVDWAISRDRYWGTPLPFWRCEDCDHLVVVESVAELSALAGSDLSELDLHRPAVDAVTLPCAEPDCGGTARRVAEVADAWLDSGAMPYAQWGYPHQGREEFARHFPADYICEAIDQTRGWFYTLLAESTMLFDQSSYKTVLCLGHIVDESGKKMSKSLGNILDPFELLDEHGADALRWLMLSEGSPWGSRRVGAKLVDEVAQRVFHALWNVHYFFLTYARLDGFDLADVPPPPAERTATDRWILAELASLVAEVDDALEGFNAAAACRHVERFVNDLSNWYVRRNRRRFWRAAGTAPADKAAAYHTLHTCLVTVAEVMAPMAPFVADQLWEDLVRSQDPGAPDSVHLVDWPEPDPAWADDALRQAMATVRGVVELGRQARSQAAVKNRQPLARAVVSVPPAERDGVAGLIDEIAEELNVHDVVLHDRDDDEMIERSLKPRFQALGPRFGKDANAVAAALRAMPHGPATALAAALETGAGQVGLDGRAIEITPDMVEVIESSRSGWQVAGDGALQIALDTALDDALVAEGAARQLIREVNQLRKEKGLALSDRIVLTVDLPGAAAAALDSGGWLEVVAGEALADRVERGAVAGGHDVDLGPLGTATVGVSRVGK